MMPLTNSSYLSLSIPVHDRNDADVHNTPYASAQLGMITMKDFMSVGSVTSKGVGTLAKPVHTQLTAEGINSLVTKIFGNHFSHEYIWLVYFKGISIEGP